MVAKTVSRKARSALPQRSKIPAEHPQREAILQADSALRVAQREVYRIHDEYCTETYDTRPAGRLKLDDRLIHLGCLLELVSAQLGQAAEKMEGAHDGS